SRSEVRCPATILLIDQNSISTMRFTSTKRIRGCGETRAPRSQSPMTRRYSTCGTSRLILRIIPTRFSAYSASRTRNKGWPMDPFAALRRLTAATRSRLVGERRLGSPAIAFAGAMLALLCYAPNPLWCDDRGILHTLKARGAEVDIDEYAAG